MTHPLRSYRTDKGITLDVLAKQVGVHKATLSKIENHTAAPSLALIAKIIEASGGELRADDFLAQAEQSA